jgi:predicted neuraminidase
MFHPQPIFDPDLDSDHPSCHAATVVDCADGSLLAAWFAGTHEGHPDVAIWLARMQKGRWSEPLRVTDQPGVPLWNPVLFRAPGGALWLFYKVGPTVPAWSGAYIRSTDDGRTWSPPALLPAGLLGPAKNKPIALSNGDIVCGTSSESWRAWACWVEISADGGASWRKVGPITAPADLGAPTGAGATASEGRPGDEPEPVSATWDAAANELTLPQGHRGVIQPTLWEYVPGRLKMLMRATQRVGVVCAAESDDYGRNWSPAVPTPLPHSNSGLDAVRLHDGRVLLACNPVRQGRTPLSLLLSVDNGVSWSRRWDVETEPGEYSYPSIIQAVDGRVHLVYTWRRRTIRHLELDPDDL